MSLAYASDRYSSTVRWLFGGAALACVLIISMPVYAESPIVEIEEDWELVVLTPDANSVGPQVVCTFAPLANLDSVYATFEINHSSTPEFSPGGLHLQVWNGECTVCQRTAPDASVMNTAGEHVTWTQHLKVQNGQLIVEVKDGHSTTWGNFGSDGTMKAVISWSVSDLNGYDPQVSIQNSGVTFAGNRVASLSLKAIRAVRADGTTITVSVDQVVSETTTP